MTHYDTRETLRHLMAYPDDQASAAAAGLAPFPPAPDGPGLAADAMSLLLPLPLRGCDAKVADGIVCPCEPWVALPAVQGADAVDFVLAAANADRGRATGGVSRQSGAVIATPSHPPASCSRLFTPFESEHTESWARECRRFRLSGAQPGRGAGNQATRAGQEGLVAALRRVRRGGERLCQVPARRPTAI